MSDIIQFRIGIEWLELCSWHRKMVLRMEKYSAQNHKSVTKLLCKVESSMNCLKRLQNMQKKLDIIPKSCSETVLCRKVLENCWKWKNSLITENSMILNPENIKSCARSLKGNWKNSNILQSAKTRQYTKRIRKSNFRTSDLPSRASINSSKHLSSCKYCFENDYTAKIVFNDKKAETISRSRSSWRCRGDRTSQLNSNVLINWCLARIILPSTD